MTHTVLDQHGSFPAVNTQPGPQFFPSLGRVLGLGPVRQWRERARFRAELRRLLRVGGYLIKDIGFSQEEAAREVNKPFWMK
ncbi:MAG: hypothetical protein QNI91_18820 [Arenicellales bacterium]|nr:hypothetical protein [Arenicellales bacterium]